MTNKQSAIRRTNRSNTGLAASWMIFGFLLIAGPLAADEPTRQTASHKAFTQPKNCFVQTAKASVRCGPGSQFYATAVLEIGAPVDVYVETSDGWSGIRPPEGSHNWIPSTSVYLLPGGKSAEISVTKVAAFIGSESDDIDSLLFQTELAQSQKVAILGEAMREEEGKQALWFRIAPPPGEFRWIRSSQLSSQPVPQVTQAIATVAATSNTAGGTTAAPPDSKPDSSVVFANSQEVVDSELVDSELVDGEVVWSDEADQLAKIEREIEREQSQSASGMSGELEGAAPSHAVRKKGTRISAYEQDQKYWSSLQSPGGQPLRVGPIGGVLGWLGISVVEDGAPTPAHRGAHQPSATHLGASQFGGALSRRGPYTPQSSIMENRLDRLPRPTRRNADGSWWSALQSEGPLFGSDVQNAAPPEEDTFSSEPTQPLDRIPVASASYRNQRMEEPRIDVGTPERFQTAAIQDAFLQLTTMVAKPTEQWNLEVFRVSAKSWVELGDTPLVRGEARLLLDRIEEFESLRTRSMSIQSPPPLTAPPLTEAVPPRVAGSGSEASGWLVSVVTSLPGQPEFALTDDAGKVLAYVRPTTGLNLRRYVQQPVTVYGAPGYIPNLAARQIVAERVVRLR